MISNNRAHDNMHVKDNARREVSLCFAVVGIISSGSRQLFFFYLKKQLYTTCKSPNSRQTKVIDLSGAFSS